MRFELLLCGIVDDDDEENDSIQEYLSHFNVKQKETRWKCLNNNNTPFWKNSQINHPDFHLLSRVTEGVVILIEIEIS